MTRETENYSPKTSSDASSTSSDADSAPSVSRSAPTRDSFRPDDARYLFPDTISRQAADGFAVLHAYYSQAVSAPDSLEEWDRRHEAIEHNVLQMSPSTELPATLLGGVDVIRVPGSNSRAHSPVLIYVHGGGHTWLSARSTLLVSKLMAEASGHEVISVDYTVAPRAKWQKQSAQVVAVYEALLSEGHAPAHIGMFGDSAGGGLVAGSVLRMRDQGIPLPGALLLLSPWSDVTGRGDSYMTLAAYDPMLTYYDLKICADAYADPADQRHPYVSPIYGDYSKPFPPTLIQGGTRELLLSDFVRHYQAIRSGGHEATLDLYEGMAHGFHTLAPAAPEVIECFATAARFWRSRLSPGG
jgi:epsilon-lactone hydrolase